MFGSCLFKVVDLLSDLRLIVFQIWFCRSMMQSVLEQQLSSYTGRTGALVDNERKGFWIQLDDFF